METPLTIGVPTFFHVLPHEMKFINESTTFLPWMSLRRLHRWPIAYQDFLGIRRQKCCVQPAQLTAMRWEVKCCRQSCLFLVIDFGNRFQSLCQSRTGFSDQPTFHGNGSVVLCRLNYHSSSFTNFRSGTSTNVDQRPVSWDGSFIDCRRCRRQVSIDYLVDFISCGMLGCNTINSRLLS